MGQTGSQTTAQPGMETDPSGLHDGALAMKCVAPNCRCESPCDGPEPEFPVLNDAEEDVYFATSYFQARGTRTILERCRVRRGIRTTYHILRRLTGLGLVEPVGGSRWQRIG